MVVTPRRELLARAAQAGQVLLRTLQEVQAQMAAADQTPPVAVVAVRDRQARAKTAALELVPRAAAAAADRMVVRPRPEADRLRQRARRVAPVRAEAVAARAAQPTRREVLERMAVAAAAAALQPGGLLQ